MARPPQQQRPNAPPRSAKRHTNADFARPFRHDDGEHARVGTDLGVSLIYPGFTVHEELRMLVELGGLSPLEALRGATVFPARSLALADSIGTIGLQMQADLVLLEGDPLQSIRHTQAIRAVVVHGRYVDRDGLNQLLIDAESAAQR